MLTLVLALSAVALPAVPAAAVDFPFAADGVLGTSLDMVVQAPDARTAAAARQAALAEIRRLEALLSTYRPGSEIARLNAAPVGSIRVCSNELREVLAACEQWRRRCGGAFNAQLGRLIDAWKQAGASGRAPRPELLASLAAEAARPAFRIDPAAGTVTRLTAAALNVDALAKGYIVDRALAAAVKVPGVLAVLLNVGGDIRAWSRRPGAGGRTWVVGVADPANPADNAPPKARLFLRNRAVATSGGYARFRTIAGRKYSHILDPRTGRPAERAASATVVAADCATADALATACSVLDPNQAVRLVGTVPGAECLIVLPNGAARTSPGWGALLGPATVAAGTAAPASAGGDPPAGPAAGAKPAPSNLPNWPAGYRVTFEMDLKKVLIRPYVTVWVEDAAGRKVRVLAVWGNKRKYLFRMTSFWRKIRGDLRSCAAVTRASRNGGHYTLVWDGKDDQGRPVPKGKYVIRLELYRKEGKHFDLRGLIECGPAPAAARIPDNPEVKNMTITYGPKGR